MLTAINDALERVAGWTVAVLFAGLIGIVALQVIARNVLFMSMIWTLDIAQLLFSWCIFIGAAIAFRRGAHYIVDLWPPRGPLAVVPHVASFLAGGVVIYVLVRNGLDMTRIAQARESQSLGISLMWFYLPIPLGGVLMALTMLERAQGWLTGAEPPTPGTGSPAP